MQHPLPGVPTAFPAGRVTLIVLLSARNTLKFIDITITEFLYSFGQNYHLLLKDGLQLQTEVRVGIILPTLTPSPAEAVSSDGLRLRS